MSYSKFYIQWVYFEGWGGKMGSRMFKKSFLWLFFFKLQNTNLNYSTVWLSEKYNKYKLKKF